MTHSRHVELQEMLDARRRAIEAQVQQKIRGFRDAAGVETTRAATDLSEDPSQEDIDFALVQIQAQTIAKITAALERLRAGEYGLCHECDEEIPEQRLRALPFAARCRTCQEIVEQEEQRDRRGQRHGFGRVVAEAIGL